MSYEVGSTYRSSVVVTDASGTPANPSTKTVTVTLPDKSTSSPTIVTDAGTGALHADYVFTVEGLHKFVWSATSPAWSRTEYVNASLWRSIISTDEAKAYVDADPSDLNILRHIMASATELAEGIAGMCVPRTFTNERVMGSIRQVIRLPHAPLPDDSSVTSITSVYTNGYTWQASDLIVFPDSGTVEPANLMPFVFGPWKATYTAGRLVIPERIQLAVKEIVFDLWALMRPYGATSLEPGPEETARYEQMLADYVIPPHAKAMLELEAIPGFGGL